MNDNLLKNILNEHCQEYVLSDEITVKLKQTILMILKDVDYVCTKYSIYYCAAYGTALGAARHQGFIPWDDDVDIFMYKDGLKKIQNCLDKEFPDKYVVSIPGTVKHDPCRFGKIMLKGTIYKEIEYAGLDWNKSFWRGISIDVFMIDPYPENRFVASIKQFFNKIFTVASSASMDFKHPSPFLKGVAKKDKQFRRYYAKRRLIGFFFFFLTTKTWTKLSLIAGSYHKKTNLVSFAYSYRYYGKIVYQKKLFDEVRRMQFENITIIMPKDYDEYLKVEFGDWHKIPKGADKEKHILAQIDFGKY